MKLAQNKIYQQLLEKIGTTFQKHQRQAIAKVYKEKLLAYWTIGQYIIEYEQAGKIKAEYGKQLLVQLTKAAVLSQISKNPDGVWKIELESFRRTIKHLR